MIAEGIIGAFLGRQGADTPSAEHIFSHEPLDRSLGFVPVCDAGPERLARIGGNDGGLPPVRLQSERVTAFIFHPKIPVEPLAQPAGLADQTIRTVSIAGPLEQFRDPEFGGIPIAL